MKKKIKSEDYTGLDHLNDLRKGVLRVCVFFALALIVAFNAVPYILNLITLSSSSVTVDLKVFNITDPLMLYFRISTLVAFIASFPYMILELWIFIRPGLTKPEKRFINMYMPLVFILFILGICFAYYILVPYYIMFSQKLAGSTELSILMGANQYIDFIGKMMLGFGIIFQLPILVLILSYLHIITSGLLKTVRKYAYFILLIVSAFLTPPDPLSMMIALMPLATLYELSIVLCRLNERKRKKNIAV